MLFNWFDASEAKKFGASLAAFYLERNPSAVSSRKEKFVAQKQQELLDKMVQQIVQFRHDNKLNIYKKAQVGNAFKWALKEAGCDAHYVDQLTNWLLHGL